MELSINKKPFRLSLGRRGEFLACEYLIQRGYKILEKNYRTSLGEIDVIAEKNKRIAFIEIKTRSSEKFGKPEEAVDKRKQNKLIALAKLYLKETKQTNKLASFHVVAILWQKPKDAKIRLIENAFEIEKE